MSQFHKDIIISVAIFKNIVFIYNITYSIVELVSFELYLELEYEFISFILLLFFYFIIFYFVKRMNFV